MNCILDPGRGLVAATLELHRAGHPEFQEVKEAERRIEKQWILVILVEDLVV